MKKIDPKVIKGLQAQISKSIEDFMGDTCPYCGGKGGTMTYQLLAVPGGNPPMKSKVFIPCYQCNGTGLYKKG